MIKFSKLFTVLAFFAGIALFGTACEKHNHETQTNAEQPSITVENFAAPLKITVSKNGFEPKSIGVKKGQTVKLAFIRTDAENCGEEIVFPKQNIKKPLPLNESVPVEFTASETGEIAFTCGMDMLRGKILVQ